jgi:hypothetical protein
LLASILKLDARARDEVLHRARNENLTGPGERGDARSRQDRDSSNLFSDDLALARVNPCANLELQLARAVDDPPRTSDCAGWAIEAAEEPVPSGVDLDASVMRKLTPNSSVMRFQHLAPAPVT